MKLLHTLSELAERNSTWGFKKLFKRLRQLGHGWNHKKVWRIYCAMKLNFRQKRRRRVYPGQGTSLVQPLAANYCWSADFMHDALSGGHRFRVLNLIDDYNREALACKASGSFPALRLIETLEALAADSGGYPVKIRSDNGPEFISVKFTLWVKSHGIELEHIKPGKPTQNSYMVRFNKTFLEDVLDFYIFSSLRKVDMAAKDFMWIRRDEIVQ